MFKLGNSYYPTATDYGTAESGINFNYPGSGGTSVIYIPVNNDSGNAGSSGAVVSGEYTLSLLETPTAGYLTSYQLKKNGSPVGDIINIPKDLLVKSAELKNVTIKNQPVQGYSIGDKYIDMTINTADDNNSLYEQHVYINVKDLTDTYFAGNGIDIVNNTVYIRLHSGNTNGLAASADGLRLAVANSSTTGALTSTDYVKFAGYEDAIKALVTWTKTLHSTTEVPEALSNFNTN